MIEKQLREELQAKKEEMERQMADLEVRCTLHLTRGSPANTLTDARHAGEERRERGNVKTLIPRLSFLP